VSLPFNLLLLFFSLTVTSAHLCTPRLESLFPPPPKTPPPPTNPIVYLLPPEVPQVFFLFAESRTASRNESLRVGSFLHSGSPFAGRAPCGGPLLPQPQNHPPEKKNNPPPPPKKKHPTPKNPPPPPHKKPPPKKKNIFAASRWPVFANKVFLFLPSHYSPLRLIWIRLIIGFFFATRLNSHFHSGRPPSSLFRVVNSFIRSHTRTTLPESSSLREGSGPGSFFPCPGLSIPLSARTCT